MIWDHSDFTSGTALPPLWVKRPGRPGLQIHRSVQDGGNNERVCSGDEGHFEVIRRGARSERGRIHPEKGGDTLADRRKRRWKVDDDEASLWNVSH